MFVTRRYNYENREPRRRFSRSRLKEETVKDSTDGENDGYYRNSSNYYFGRLTFDRRGYFVKKSLVEIYYSS